MNVRELKDKLEGLPDTSPIEVYIGDETALSIANESMHFLQILDIDKDFEESPLITVKAMM